MRELLIVGYPSHYKMVMMEHCIDFYTLNAERGRSSVLLMEGLGFLACYMASFFSNVLH
jgi:hypothetical protein